jgi:hypothetical protein
MTYLRCAERLDSADHPAAVLVARMAVFLAPRGLAFIRAQAAIAGLSIVSRVS